MQRNAVTALSIILMRMTYLIIIIQARYPVCSSHYAGNDSKLWSD